MTTIIIPKGSFYVIMTQVDYDSNYDKGYDGYQDIIRIDIQVGPDFRPKMIVGETAARLGHKVLMPYSVAMRCFGRADCIGETLSLPLFHYGLKMSSFAPS